MADNSAASPAGSPAFEKLGLFYLGRRHDIATGKTLDEPVLYDSRDLVTHAVCIGMTGSGKTGLCLGLIEEAAIDGVPVIAIDPKGDLGNLLLTFPGLSAGGVPAVGQRGRRAARRAGRRRVRGEGGAAVGRGLEAWGQDGAANRAVAAGRGVRDLHARQQRRAAGLDSELVRARRPRERDDTELLAERAGRTATSAAGAGRRRRRPPRSREHILVATLLTHAWQARRRASISPR